MFETITAAPGRPRPLTLAVTLSGLRNRTAGQARRPHRDRPRHHRAARDREPAASGREAHRARPARRRHRPRLQQPPAGDPGLRPADEAEPGQRRADRALAQRGRVGGHGRRGDGPAHPAVRPPAARRAVRPRGHQPDRAAIRWRSTRPRWEEKIAHESRPLELRLDLQATEFPQGRPAALTEVLTNLILNAMDAMPHGGTLTIATHHTAGRDVRVTVADTGIGMSESVRQRIFEPFFSTKGEGGLGSGPVDGLLDRAAPRGRDPRGHGAVRRHDVHTDFPGRARVARPGVPGSADRHAPARAHPRSWTTIRKCSRRSPRCCAAWATRCLRRRPAARRIAEYQPGRFDIVITNIGMAGMNGWEVAERLRAIDTGVAAALHHGLGTTGRGPRSAGRARRQALPVQTARPDRSRRRRTGGAGDLSLRLRLASSVGHSRPSAPSPPCRTSDTDTQPSLAPSPARNVTQPTSF